MNTRRCLALAIATLVALPTVAMAEQGRVYINPAVGIMDWDSNLGLEDESVYGQLGVEARLTDRLGLELKYGFASPDAARGSGDADFSTFGLDMLYYFGRFGANNAWEPYVAAGVGHGEYDPSGDAQRDEQTIGNAGFGVRYHFADRWSLRADARALNHFDNHQVQAQYTLGVSYALGGSSAPVAEPEPAPMPAAPADSDGDGVPDDRDRCPNTPRDREVDENGCEYVLTKTETLRMEVLFAFDSADVPEAYMGEIEKVAKFLRHYGGTSAQIEGHTDSVGPDAYNKGLSQRRADAVREALISRFGIDASRLTTVGYGEERPIESNDTDEGRHQNRRVVAVVQAQVEEPALKK